MSGKEGLVAQRSAFDCGICCLAMLVGKPYEAVLDAVGDTYDPARGMANTSKALARLDLPQFYRLDVPIERDGHIFLHRHVVGPEYFRNFAWGRRAIMSVPSLNYAGGAHLVFWDGVRVFDPSLKNRYTEFGQLLPDEITLFVESGLRSLAPSSSESET